MKKRNLTLWVIFFLLFLLGCSQKPKSNGEENQTVKKDGSVEENAHLEELQSLFESAEKQLTLYAKAKELAEKGKYADAALVYEKLLKLNNTNPRILLDASYAYFDSGNYEKSLEYALKAAEFDTDFKYEIFVEIANSYDMLGESQKAIEYYKKALKEKPDYNYLYYNLAITYYRIGNKEKARMLLKKTLSLEPNMAEAHLVLGEIYYNDNYTIPALLAYSRVVLIDLKSGKRDLAFERIQSILMNGVENKDGNINILFNPEEPEYDGDFSAITLAFNMKKALDLGEKIIPENEIDRVSDWFNTLFTLLEEMQKGNKGFVWEFYVPYFVEMKNKGYVKPFVIILYYKKYPYAAKSWLDKKENEKLFEEFAEWDKNYKFKVPDIQVEF